MNAYEKRFSGATTDGVTRTVNRDDQNSLTNIKISYVPNPLAEDPAVIEPISDVIIRESGSMMNRQVLKQASSKSPVMLAAAAHDDEEETPRSNGGNEASNRNQLPHTYEP